MVHPGVRTALWLVVGVVGMTAVATAAGAEATVGWRGNWTGRFPDAKPPVTWAKLSKLMAGLRCQADRPAGDGPGGAAAHHGSPTRWLILGPVSSAGLTGQADWRPAAGEKLAGAAWRSIATFGSEINDPLLLRTPDDKVLYLHTYLHAPVAGAVEFRCIGGRSGLAKMYVNGDLVHPYQGRRRPPIKLTRGWNRLLCEVVTPARTGKPLFTYLDRCGIDFGLRAAPPYDTDARNILWAAPLPHWGGATPVIVGDSVFVMSEPGDLVCLDKNTGRIKWIRSTTFHDVADERTRQDPAFKAVAALVARLDALNGRIAKTGKLSEDILKRHGDLHTRIAAAMRDLNREKYYARTVHTGQCVPTPVSDGRCIYLRLANGIATCFDLAGNRKWAAAAGTGYHAEHGFNSSVALVAGRLIVLRGDVTAYDAATGRVAWRAETGKLRLGSTTPLGLTIGGKDVVWLGGRVFDPADGKILWADGKWLRTNCTAIVAAGRLHGAGDAGLISSPLPKTIAGFAPAGKTVALYKGVRKQRASIVTSPLVHEGLLYVVDVMGTLYVVDAKANAVVYSRPLGVGPEWYTSVYPKGTCYASPVLAGGHIYVVGAAGVTVVLKPGRTYEEVARNKIEDVADCDRYYRSGRRRAPKIETFVSTPVAEGDRLYLRGDRFLYCIGKPR